MLYVKYRHGTQSWNRTDTKAHTMIYIANLCNGSLTVQLAIGGQ